MYAIIKKFVSLLAPAERRGVAMVCASVVVSAVAEALSVGLIVPLLVVLSRPEASQSLRLVALVRESLGDLSNADFAFFFGISVIGFMAFASATSLVTRRLLLRFSYQRYQSLSVRLFEHIVREDLAFHLKHSSASLVDTVVVDCDAVVGKVFLGLMMVFSNLALAACLLALAFLVQPILSLAAFACLAGLYFLTYRFVRKRFAESGRRHGVAAKRHAANLSQALVGIRELKVFGAEVLFLKRHAELSMEKTQAATQSLCLAELPRKLIESIAIVGTLLVMIVATRFVGDTGQLLPMTAFFVFAAYRFLPCLQQVYQHLVKIRFHAPSLDSVCEILDRPYDPSPFATHTPPRGDIVLDRVCFAYPEASRLALDRVSIKIPEGSRVALVGKTGSGKTTAINLILGLLKPTEGQVSVGGTRLDEGCIGAWQSGIGYVPQHVALIDDTVLMNIAFGVPEPDRKRAVNAAKAAQMHEFIATQLEHGYDTVIGENGVRLSGGERQRLGIARALYRSPSVLVLDEATSALDNTTQQAVLQDLLSRKGAYTVIQVTHRASALRDIDLIVYFAGGRVIDAGAFDDLQQRCPSFAVLV